MVLNRRFLVLGPTRMPNLASRALALATQALPEHWQQAHGYQPLLAETFSDIEQYEDACCRPRTADANPPLRQAVAPDAASGFSQRCSSTKGSNNP